MSFDARSLGANRVVTDLQDQVIGGETRSAKQPTSRVHRQPVVIDPSLGPSVQFLRSVAIEDQPA